MRIAHICPRLKFRGGTERFVIEVNSAMKELGVESDVYSIDLSPRPALLSDVALSTLLAGRALRDGFDALVFHQGQAASALFKSVRTIGYFHQIKYDELAGEGIVRNTYRGFLGAIERHLTRAVCNSRYAASRLSLLLPYATINVVYPGVRQRPPSDEPIGDGFCYCHSRFHPRKNQIFLLSVFERLPYKLWLTGGTWDRRFRKYHADLIKAASQMPNVHLSTNIGETLYSALLSKSALFCFPAQMEPFGLVLLEAMAFGKAIIALESGASPEVLAGAGVMCKPHIEDWRAAINRILADRELRNSLSKKSMARASEFTWHKTAKELTRILESE